MSLYAYDRLGPSRYRERFGLDFEDFEPGQRFRHRPGITVSQQDNTEEALDTLNSAMLHFDRAYAEHTPFGRPLVVSTLTVQRTLGMTMKTFARRRELLEIEEISLPAPVFDGDTLYAESAIEAVEAGEDTEAGVVTVTTRGATASGTEVVVIRYRLDVYRRGHGPDPGGERAAEPRFAAYQVEDGVHLERAGLCFEELLPGESFVHSPRRTVLLEDAVAHARRSLDYSSAYHDFNPSRPYRVSPTFVLAVAATPSTRTFGRVVANLGWYETRLPQPVFAGDTLEAETEILEARDSKSRPREGVLVVRTRARNQRGEEVLSFRRHLLVHRRGAPTYRAAGYAG